MYVSVSLFVSVSECPSAWKYGFYHFFVFIYKIKQQYVATSN